MSNAKTIFIICIIFYSCSIYAATNTNGNNWAEKLGYPKGSRVVILHADDIGTVYYTHIRAHETSLHLVCRLMLEKINQNRTTVYTAPVQSCSIPCLVLTHLALY